jgi:polysaccharide export outer membrane protein
VEICRISTNIEVEKEMRMIEKLSLVKRFIYVLLIIPVYLQSCSSSKNLLFTSPNDKDIPNVPVFELQKGNPNLLNKEQTLQAGDIFTITNLNNQILVTGINPDETQISNTEFNYFIKKNGEAELPILGTTKLSGLTIGEAENKINSLYKQSLLNTNAQLVIKLVNMKVFLMGKGEQILSNENINLTEIIGKAGGLTKDANLKRVKIIRGDLKDPQILLVNLNDINSLKDDRLQLKNKDIIYAEPKASANLNNKVGLLTTVLGIGLSIINLYFVFSRL